MADEKLKVPLGFRFIPTDAQLITNYLTPKVLGQDLPVFSEEVIFERDLYANEPCTLFDEMRHYPYYNYDISNEDPGNRDDEHCCEVRYFFTKLKRKSEKTKRISRTVNGTGTWKGECSGKPILDYKNMTIGMKKSFSFELNRKSSESSPKRRKTTDNWIMHEYSLPETFPNEQGYVLCRIRRKVNGSERRTESSMSMAEESLPSEPLVSSTTFAAPPVKESQQEQQEMQQQQEKQQEQQSMQMTNSQSLLPADTTFAAQVEGSYPEFHSWVNSMIDFNSIESFDNEMEHQEQQQQQQQQQYDLDAWVNSMIDFSPIESFNNNMKQQKQQQQHLNSTTTTSTHE